MDLDRIPRLQAATPGRLRRLQLGRGRSSLAFVATSGASRFREIGAGMLGTFVKMEVAQVHALGGGRECEAAVWIAASFRSYVSRRLWSRSATGGRRGRRRMRAYRACGMCRCLMTRRLCRCASRSGQQDRGAGHDCTQFQDGPRWFDWFANFRRGRRAEAWPASELSTPCPAANAEGLRFDSNALVSYQHCPHFVSLARRSAEVESRGDARGSSITDRSSRHSSCSAPKFDFQTHARSTRYLIIRVS